MGAKALLPFSPCWRHSCSHSSCSRSRSLALPPPPLVALLPPSKAAGAPPLLLLPPPPPPGTTRCSSATMSLSTLLGLVRKKRNDEADEMGEWKNRNGWMKDHKG